MKKGRLLGGLIGLLLTGCVTFHGNLDLAYVPKRTDDQAKENEIKVAMEIFGEFPISRDIDLYAGGKQTCYAEFPDNSNIEENGFDFTFNPTWMVFDTYFGLKIGRVNLYYKHMCSHSMEDEEKTIYSCEDLTPYIVNYDSSDEIGVKIHF